MQSDNPTSMNSIDVGERRPGKSLWQVAAVIMLIVFGPAMLACMVMLLKHFH
jgi:hypothetical protein